MHTIELHNGNHLKLPESIAEFDKDQYLDFCKLMVEFTKGHISYGSFRIRLLYALLDMVPSNKVLSADEQDMRNENVYRLSELIDYYFEDEHVEGEIVKNIRFEMVSNLIDRFELNGTFYYGPADALQNVVFDEILEANKHLHEYINSKSDESLDRLVATFYRPKKKETEENIFRNYDGDLREEFVGSNVERRANKLKGLPVHIKYGIYVFYVSCQKFITTASNLEVDGQTVDLSVLFRQNDSGNKGIGMPGLLFSLAETGVFGDIKKTSQEKYWNVLLRLYQNHLTMQELKRKYNAERN